MDKHPERSGQALVETALLLPLLFLIFAGMLQFLFLIYVQMHLQQTASRLATLHSTGASNFQIITELSRRHPKGPSWGFLDPSSTRIHQIPLHPWRAYPGITTLRTPGALSVADLTYRFYPRFLVRWNHRTGAYVERPKEPRLEEPAE